MFQLVWDRHRRRERRFYFQTHVLLPCLHVTHGALCPSPTGTVVNSRPKYVKVNPSRAVPRRASPRSAERENMSKSGHHHGWGGARLSSRRGPTPHSVRTTPNYGEFVPLFFFFFLSLYADMSLPVVLPGSCCPVAGASQLAEPPYRHRPRGLSASSRLVGGGPRLLLPGRPLLSLGLLQLLLGASMVALSFGALSLSNSPAIRNSCPFWAGSSVSVLAVITRDGARVLPPPLTAADNPRARRELLTYSDIDSVQFCT